MPRIPAASENAAGNAVLVAGTTYYLSLHSADPGTTGASELTGGGYVRQAIVFTTWSAGGTSNTAAIAVPNAGTTAAAYFGVWSASTSGTYLIGGALASSATAASITVAVGAITAAVA